VVSGGIWLTSAPEELAQRLEAVKRYRPQQSLVQARCRIGALVAPADDQLRSKATEHAAAAVHRVPRASVQAAEVSQYDE